MILRQVQVGDMLNFAYIIGDTETMEGLVIDPSWEPERLYSIAKEEGLVIKYILNTHCHEDHVNGNRKMKELTGASIAIHEAESKYLRHFFPPEADIKLNNNDRVYLGNIPVGIIHTPGHSPGSICIIADNNMFTGDTLFVGSCGRTDLPGGDDVEFARTMQTLKEMDDSIIVCPGHNYGGEPVSSMGKEKRQNQCLLSVS